MDRPIRFDNGPGMTSDDFTEWAARKGIALRFIEPGEPNQSAYIERFDRTYRHEVLDAYLLTVYLHRTGPEHHRGVAALI
jgi:transposase InsO family protein